MSKQIENLCLRVQASCGLVIKFTLLRGALDEGNVDRFYAVYAVCEKIINDYRHARDSLENMRAFRTEATQRAIQTFPCFTFPDDRAFSESLAELERAVGSMKIVLTHDMPAQTSLTRLQLHHLQSSNECLNRIERCKKASEDWETRVRAALSKEATKEFLIGLRGCLGKKKKT